MPIKEEMKERLAEALANARSGPADPFNPHSSKVPTIEDQLRLENEKKRAEKQRRKQERERKRIEKTRMMLPLVLP